MKDIIKITQENTYDFFEEKTVDHIFQKINRVVTKDIMVLSNQGIGCLVFENITMKNGESKNVYVEYTFEILGSKNEIPIPLKVDPHEVLLFDGMPNEISIKVDKVKTLVNEYGKLN